MFFFVFYLLFLLFLLFLVFWEFSLKSNGISNISRLRIAMWSGFILFFGFRGFVNTDCLSYYPFFENLKTVWDNVSYEQVITGYGWEPGFITVVYLLKSIIPNYQVWILLWCVIIVSGVDFIFTRYVKYYSLAFLLFFIFSGYGIITNLMRASIAMFLFLLSVPCLERGNLKRYLLLNSLGCLFHISSVIYLLSYSFFRKKIPFGILLFVFVIVITMCFLRIDLSNLFVLFSNIIPIERILLLTERYTDSASSLSILSVGNLERWSTYLLVCLSYKRMVRDNPSSIIFLNGYVAYFVFFYLFHNLGDVAQRLSLLFVFSYWIFYSMFYEYLKLKRRKLVFIFLLSIYAVLKTVSGMSAPYHEYKNILWNDESFEDAKARIVMTE